MMTAARGVGASAVWMRNARVGVRVTVWRGCLCGACGLLVRRRLVHPQAQRHRPGSKVKIENAVLYIHT